MNKIYKIEDVKDFGQAFMYHQEDGIQLWKEFVVFEDGVEGLIRYEFSDIDNDIDQDNLDFKSAISSIKQV